MSEEKAKQSDLFRILQPAGCDSGDAQEIPAAAAELKGIARLAASGSSAGAGHLVEYRTLPVRSILNHSVSRRGLWFAKSINPYRGCEFGCRYCYARYTHEFMEMKDPADFEHKIYIKQNAQWLLRQELRSLPAGMEVAIGTATDPYQPIERRAKVTRGILEVFAEQRGLRLGIVTKATLIERDIDLLQRIAAQNELVLHITITTNDAKLARILEPRAPRPELRFRTVRRLREAGLRTGILCSPLLPGITDNARALDTMGRKAREVDASFFAASPLFLKPCSKGTFLAFIHEHFPQLDESYAARYDTEAFVSRAYQARVRDLVAAVVAKYGLGHRLTEAILPRDTEQGSVEDGKTSVYRTAEREGDQAELWPQPKAPRRNRAAAADPQRVMMTS
jgi:DNA repair photolyase